MEPDEGEEQGGASRCASGRGGGAAWLRACASLGALDWIAILLLALGLSFVAAGLLPMPDAVATLSRILPLLIFLASVIVLAELTARAEVFDVISVRLARMARGNYLALFLLSGLFAAVTTATLNLDTTAVLLTPVMLTTARRARIDPVPLAMTTVWLANTASLLLPVSNLTNLLAANRVALSSVAFAARMAVPELLSVTATMAALWFFYWRRRKRDAEAFVAPPRYEPADRLLFGTAAAACLLFIGGVLLSLPLPVTSFLSAGIVVFAFACRDRCALRLGLFPWRLLVFVSGLFLVVQTVSQHGLDRVVHAMLGVDGGALGVFRATASGAVLSNALNNLPSYVAGEAVVPLAHHQQLLGLLIGTNVGPIVTPWASLATLLWYERCRSNGVHVAWSRFVLTGAATSVGALIVTAWALVATVPVRPG